MSTKICHFNVLFFEKSHWCRAGTRRMGYHTVVWCPPSEMDRHRSWYSGTADATRPWHEESYHEVPAGKKRKVWPEAWFSASLLCLSRGRKKCSQHNIDLDLVWSSIAAHWNIWKLLRMILDQVLLQWLNMTWYTSTNNISCNTTPW